MATNSDRKVIVRNVVLTIAAVGALPFVVSGVRGFLSSDPFAAFRSPANEKRPDKSIELNDVSLRHYRKGQLVTKGKVDSVVVGMNRNEFHLDHVTNGVYNSEQGPIQFAGRDATLNAMNKSVEIKDDVRIQHKDFDLTTRALKFTGNESVLQTTQPVSGKLYGGDATADGFRFNSKTKSFVVGKNSWKGNLALNLHGQDEQRPTRWSFQGASMKNDPKTGDMTYITGQATDQEIILLADKVVYNKKTDVVTGFGNVRYFAPEANLTADKVVVYRKEKRAVLTDHVRMLVKPEEQQAQPAKIEPIPEFKLLVADQVSAEVIAYPKTDEEKKQVEELRSADTMKKYPLQLASDYIEYWYGKGNRHATIKGNPQARQDFTSGMWRHLWTDHALYDGEKDLLTLISGDKDLARMKNSYGDDAIAKQFLVSTKKDDDEYSGEDIKSTIAETEPDERDKKTTPPPVKTGGGAPSKAKS